MYFFFEFDQYKQFIWIRFKMNISILHADILQLSVSIWKLLKADSYAADVISFVS